ncbi:unnamed protein product [Cylicocyclus nassatus]|uniref:Uncharacterized protein n=1 Tax=Cylicocyclus nassatus TaxID=53992 RepID=A0AA36M806_CYLNA|nr:unnamed protein product [Cylicocyclus nassatus]
MVQTLFMFYSALILRKQLLGIRCGMLKVIISERLPHEQVFPLLSLHLFDLHQQLHGLSFIGLCSFDRHLLTAYLLLNGLAAFYGYHHCS